MAAAQCRSSKCTAERKGFRRELDSWRHKLIHCIGFESILEGIYGPLLLRDLNIFDDCEPEEVDDWSAEASCSNCSFCNLPLDKICDHVPAAASPLSSPSDYSPSQALPLSDSSQSAHRFLQAVFHKKDVPVTCDANIPLVAQELMKKMIHQFAIEYASKSKPHISRNGLAPGSSSPLSDAADPDAPLDLTVSRNQETIPQPDGVLDLSTRNPACSTTSSAANHKASGRQRRQREEYVERSWELSEGLLSKALKDVRSGRLPEQRASLLYGIPLRTLKQGLERAAEEGPRPLLPPHRRCHVPESGGAPAEELTSYGAMSSMLGGEARLVLQRVAAWAERAEVGGEAEEKGDVRVPSSSSSLCPSLYQPGSLQKTLSLSFPQLRDALQPQPSPVAEPPAPLRIPQVRSSFDHHRPALAEPYSQAEALLHPTPTAEGAANSVTSNAARPPALFKVRPPMPLDARTGAAATSSSHRPGLGPRSSPLDDPEEADRRDKDKQPRKKRGRYRQYDHELLEEAITMVMAGRMSVSKAQGVYGIPHSTLEYKVKERSGTLKNPPKKKSANPALSNSAGSGATTCSVNSGTTTSAAAAAAKSLLSPAIAEDLEDPVRQPPPQSPALEVVFSALCPAHRSLLYQILKLAYQEGLLSLPQRRPTSQTDSHCCYHGVAPPANSTHCQFSFNNCKARGSSPHYPPSDHDHQGHSGAHHPTDSNPSRSIRQHPFKGCKSPVPHASTCCCLQTCRVAAYPVFCLKNLPYISCQSLDVEHLNHSNASSPSLSSTSLCSTSSCLCPSSSLYPASSICCSHHNPRPCPCYADHTCLTQVNHKIEEGDEGGDLLYPGVKREPPHSPSPPPLSPIHSDINGKTEEKPPYLLHHGDDGGDLTPAVKAQDDLDSTGQEEAEAESKCEKMKEGWRSRAVQNPSGSLLQDVVDRFSERLETIRPLEKDLPQNSMANQSLDKKPPLASSASQSVQSHDDDHFSEIITKVLGTGRDYNLNELFHRHDNNEAKSPNTRSRRRQEMLAASPDSTSTWRNSLKIKRELALLDLSYCRRRLSLTKRGRLKDGKLVISPTSSSSSETTPVKEESDREIEIQEVKGVCEIQEILAVRQESRMETVKTGDDRHTDDGEIECVTTVVQDGKISEASERGNLREDGEICQDEEIMLTAYEGRRNDVKEEIETVIVTEEIEKERIKLEMTHEAATVEENQGTPVSTTELKSYLPGTKEKALGHNGAWNKDSGTRQTGSKTSQEEGPCSQTCDSPPTKDKGHPTNVRGRKKASFPCQPCSSRGTGRSRRNINPPQRFASYVTEPRKMYFAACFSESIFNHRTAKENISKNSYLDTSSVNPDGNNPNLESEQTLNITADLQSEPALESTPKEQSETSNIKVKDQSQVIVATTERSLSNHSSQNKTNVKDGANRPYGRLRSSMSKRHNIEIESAPRKTPKRFNSNNSSSSATGGQSHPNFQTAYTSPIKLMYVSPVMDKEGVKYSLKSAVSGSSGQGEETFDPCEESSWAGTPTNSPCNEDATTPQKPVPSPRKCSAISPKHPSTPPKSSTSPIKPASTPSKSSTSPIKPASTPSKSSTSPIKSASTPSKSSSSPLKSSSSSPRSSTSSPKVGSKRSGESTPTKRGSGTENQRSPGSLKGVSEKQNESASFHETTPPKRRPGRPKKLGPQLEKKVKRPIGRPRKEKDGDVKGSKAENVKAVVGSDTEEKTNKNLKITVLYGRSRRNKRLVSVGCSQLQTEVHGPQQAGDRNGDLSIILHNSQSVSGCVKATSSKWSEELHFIKPVKDKETPLHSSSNIKCQKLQGAVAMRKPGRPAKVKISGISVTVTTVSPRQRKIQMNKDTRLSPKTLNHKKTLLLDNKSAKEPTTISVQSKNDSSQTEETIEVKDKQQSKHPDRPVAVRHSVRVRKPSVYLLHSVATSRSYSHSTALLKRSRKLLLNKVSNQRRQEEAHGEVEVAEGKRQALGQGRKQVCHNLSRVAGVSVDSIFPPGETLRWWAPSAEEDTLNQELARRIRLVSDTWVSDNIENQGEMAFKPTLRVKRNRSYNKSSRHSSVVRMLFDCPPRKPRTCSMQQLSSWFMQTTETQSLAIVKKSSSRNPYELMHYPRSSSKGNTCHSPQAERLRKHIKKFAKIVPKSPSQHQQAQDRLWDRKLVLSNTAKRQLFTPRFPLGRLNEGAPWWRGRALGKYLNVLLRAKARFLTRKERQKWPAKQKNTRRPSLRWKLSASHSPGHLTAHQPRDKAFSISATDGPYNYLKNSCTTSPADLTQAPTEVPKEQRLSSKAWSPETLKECRVFLKKINSPVNESTAEEWDSCTVTLDDESSSALRLAGREKEPERDVKAVKTRRKKKKRRRKKRTANKLELESSPSEANQNQDGEQLERREGKCESPAGVSSEPPHPPPAKMLRQSRVRGLTGPRWCDFVVGN